MLGEVCMDTKTVRETGREILSLCFSPSVCLPSFFTKHPTLLRWKQIPSRVLSSKSEQLGGKFLLCQQGNKSINKWKKLHNLKSEYMTVLKWFVCSTNTGLPVFQPADPLEETDLPGIVFRLSSLTITKALIRLDSSSSVGSDGSLVLLLCLSLDVVRVCGLFF